MGPGLDSGTARGRQVELVVLPFGHCCCLSGTTDLTTPAPSHGRLSMLLLFDIEMKYVAEGHQMRCKQASCSQPFSHVGEYTAPEID